MPEIPDSLSNSESPDPWSDLLDDIFERKLGERRDVSEIIDTSIKPILDEIASRRMTGRNSDLRFDVNIVDDIARQNARLVDFHFSTLYFTGERTADDDWFSIMRDAGEDLQLQDFHETLDKQIAQYMKQVGILDPANIPDEVRDEISTNLWNDFMTTRRGIMEIYLEKKEAKWISNSWTQDQSVDPNDIFISSTRPGHTGHCIHLSTKELLENSAPLIRALKEYLETADLRQGLASHLR